MVVLLLLVVMIKVTIVALRILDDCRSAVTREEEPELLRNSSVRWPCFMMQRTPRPLSPPQIATIPGVV